jgi:hypothetical protein
MNDYSGTPIDSSNYDLFPSARGRSEFMKYAQGKALTRGDSIKAKCYECMGCFVDGKQDCKMSSCPLYPYRPYKK